MKFQQGSLYLYLMKKKNKIVKIHPAIKKLMNKMYVPENFNHKEEIKKIFSNRNLEN